MIKREIGETAYIQCKIHKRIENMRYEGIQDLGKEGKAELWTCPITQSTRIYKLSDK